METRTHKREGASAAPLRQCALTRERLPVDALIRFALSPEGEAVPDLKNWLPGRGVWLTARREIVEKAVAAGIFSRAFRRQVHTAADLGSRIALQLERQALERLSLANKAGAVVSGQVKVEQALSGDGVGALLHGRDGAPGGREKLDRLAARANVQGITCFTVAQLSLALGRSNVVHAAVRQGGVCESFLQAVHRLQHYRNEDAAPTAA
ncbi:MAG: RNA-binding protein [Methyloligellaceae bacterium]